MNSANNTSKKLGWNRIRGWFNPTHIKQTALYHFTYYNKILPGNLHQYPPRPLRKEIFPNLPLPKNSPTLCIITPSFNQGAYIRATVASILQDRLPHLDYLVMDGASRDNTCEILEKLSKENSFRWQSAPDQGQTDAINRGFRQVQGDLMAWINSDDILLPGALRFITAFFATHPEVDVVYGHRLLINETGQEIGRWIVPAHYKNSLKHVDFVPQETLFWRRRIWEKVGGHVNENYYFALDWELLQRFERAGAKFIRLPYFLGCFRVHKTQKTTLQMNEIGKREMQSLCPEFKDPTKMRNALWKEHARARLCSWFFSCGIRSTQF